MKIDAKLVAGVLFFLMNLATFILGVVLLFTGLGFVGSDGGEGGIHLVVKKVGEITGINGHMVVFLAGIAMILAAVGYARKAYQEARAFEGGLPDTIRHFSPF